VARSVEHQIAHEISGILLTADRWRADCSRVFETRILDERKSRRVAREVLSYFVRHPQATDTMEGIARWRLLDELARRTVDETGAALKWLVARGFLVEISPSASPLLYHLNHTKIGAAQKFVGLRRKSPDIKS
jgi:hypothetical protein